MRHPDADRRHGQLMVQRLQAEVDQLRQEREQLLNQLDAAYDAHAGECAKCRYRWALLRKQREREG